MLDVIVIGGGVSGLSCALTLLESGRSVELWSARPAEETTSAVAGAIWYPYKVDGDERVGRWAVDSLHIFRALSDVPGSGVALVRGRELFVEAEPELAWRRRLGPLNALPPEKLPPGYRIGRQLDLPVIEMPVYLPWLRARVERAGGRLLERRVRALDEALSRARIVVNCTGLEAQELTSDSELFPIRGLVLWCERAGIDDFTLDDFNPAGPTYVIPRSRDCVLGGTAEEGQGDLVYDPRDAAAILERCAALEPTLAGARLVGQRVGLRPGRRRVRVELERRDGDRAVIHDYGHGGAGVTLSWGCAAEVHSLCEQALRKT
jgi:D-amino-acid oxidase